MARSTADAQAQLRLDALPPPGTPLTLDARLLTIFAGLLALLLALLVGLYIRRGDLAAVFGLAPGAVTRRRAKSRAAAPHEEERTALLRQLLALEQARAKGKLDAEAYRREEAATRDKLKSLLIQTDTANAPVATTNVAETSARQKMTHDASATGPAGAGHTERRERMTLDLSPAMRENIACSLQWHMPWSRAMCARRSSSSRCCAASR